MDVQLFLAHTAQTIAEYGWSVTCVFPTPEIPGAPFAYTAGMTAHQLPELVISGAPDEVAHALLNAAAKRQLSDGQAFTAGTLVAGVAPVPLRVVAAPLAEISVARVLYPDAWAVQLLWPDDAGVYPDEPAWPTEMAQPIYQ